MQKIAYKTKHKTNIANKITYAQLNPLYTLLTEKVRILPWAVSRVNKIKSICLHFDSPLTDACPAWCVF